MSVDLENRAHSVPSFESVEALKHGLEAKSRFEPVDLYPRDGSGLLGEVESRIADIEGVESEQLLVYNSGMSAVTDAIDVALYQRDDARPLLACSSETYTQTKRYIENFVRGNVADIVYFDSADNEAIDNLIQNRQPDVIVSETVSNFVNVPVLDTSFLLQRARESEKIPTVVLDNTLPLSTALPLGEILEESDKTIVAVSGTKSYTFNKELLGIVYTKNEYLQAQLKQYRRTRGSLPGTQSLELTSNVLPESKEEFDERNLRLFKNTGQIALNIAAMSENNTDYLISHPALSTHDCHEFYSREYPDQATPLFYIQSAKFDQYEVASRLWAHPDVREQAELGQSFGFDTTRIVADENIGAVRISGGAETNGEAFGMACGQALYGGGARK